MNAIKYIRDGRNPIGVMFTVVDENGNTDTGFSFCNKEDSFDKPLGRKIAKKRAEAGTYTSIPNRKVFCSYSKKTMTLHEMVINELNIFPDGEKENNFYVDFSNDDSLPTLEDALREFMNSFFTTGMPVYEANGKHSP